MPQMSPLNWFFLFIFFITIFFLFNLMNYYNFFYLPNKKNNSMKYNFLTMTWKW